VTKLPNSRYIQLKEVKQHNLKGFDLELPFYRLIVVTGVSGAGKSSLVFDTLYAEGQRRYIETFSAYIRQYFERLPRPRVKEILNIPAALAFPQGNYIRTSRSTVATLTEISHFTRMLYYQEGVPVCPRCNKLIQQRSPYLIAREILERFKGKGIYLLVPQRVDQSLEHFKDGLLALGFSRVLLKGQLCDVEELEEEVKELDLVIYRVKPREEDFQAILESVEQAFKISDVLKVRTLYGEEVVYYKTARCEVCGYTPPSKNPNLFSFNSSQGACPECNGFGNLLVVDYEALVKHPEKSLRHGAIPLINYPFLTEVARDLFDFLREKGFSPSTPFNRLPDKLKRAIFHGEGRWYGLKEVVEWLESKKYKPHIRILLSKLRREVKCPKCKGTRFNPKALEFVINGLNIGEFYELDVSSAKKFVLDFLEKNKSLAGERLGKEVLKRLEYLEQVGLGYLTLSRASKTLSGGEASRCLLTRALSSNLVETLYVIDEPTTGLHPRDTQRILRFMENLVSQRNTVVVVEHDPEVVVNADFLIDLGPEGGEKGGHLLYAGSPKGIFQNSTPTSEVLNLVSKKRKVKKKKKSQDALEFLHFKNAKEFNLKGFDVRIPIGSITSIVGVSGSGKSTLLERVIQEQAKELADSGYPAVLLLSQEPLAKSPRAVVATYIDVFTYIRQLFASTPLAKKLGFSQNFFSFNSEQAQCPECKGLGFEVIEMQFLSDLVIPCEFCNATRYRKEVLEIKWKGKNIAEVLEMTVKEALKFFSGHPIIASRLEILEKLGLGYLKLGQPLSTLSGGEAQRLKIAEAFIKTFYQKYLVLLDEPTVGLHLKDVENLVSALKYLTQRGHTVVLVEHNPEVILASDWVIELGPGGGEEGGYLLFEGVLEEFLKASKASTPTATYLREYTSGLKLKQQIREKTERFYEESLIKLRGIRHHNLRNLDIDIPRNKFVVVTGVSGSGKSTLAFDVIFSEGQRRFLETLPAYLRQFFKLHEEIDFDLISGIPPTVALEQKSGEASPRSTVGTMTDILPYLRLLFAKISRSYCPSCGKEVGARTEKELLDLAVRRLKDIKSEVLILAPLIRYRKGFYKHLFQKLLHQGYHQVRIDKTFYKIPPIPRLSRFKEHFIEVVIGKCSPGNIEAFKGLFERALREGNGEAVVTCEEGEFYFSKRRVCVECGKSLPEPDPLLFAFNSKRGACKLCQGLGYLDGEVCPECRGTRYAKEVWYYKINGMSLPELCEMSILKLKEFLKSLRLEGRDKLLGEELISEVTSRLDCLIDLGLGYLSLGRSGNTLSSGETKRVKIAAAVGSNLTGVGYILDEPTIGLHPKDTSKLIKVLKKLRDKGNTVIVVEHDEDVIKSADFVIDMGPSGGKKGGKVVFAGEVKRLFDCKDSVTAASIKDATRKTIKSLKRHPEKFMILKGVKFRNLKGFDVKIPLNTLTVVVGVSGSGKSSLVCDLLYPILKKRTSRGTNYFSITGEVKDVLGADEVKQVYLVDHSPIGNTPKSTPATYIGVFTEIRKLFAQCPLARERGYREGKFSFNTVEGGCPYCKGHGYVKAEIKFLPEVYQVCEYCQGKRYRPDVLEIRLKGKSIADVLAMTFEEAREFFKDFPSVFRKLDTVCKIGLEYLTLGQPSPTLSGGEAQRIKLAKEFVKSTRQKNLYILDEPTTGLHIKDVEKLVTVLQGLVEKGHTVLVIEHNMELVKWADWVIELGPGGGEEGGYLLFEGVLEEFLKASRLPPQQLKY